jgi:hypothetical protein
MKQRKWNYLKVLTHKGSIRKVQKCSKADSNSIEKVTLDQKKIVFNNIEKMWRKKIFLFSHQRRKLASIERKLFHQFFFNKPSLSSRRSKKLNYHDRLEDKTLRINQVGEKGLWLETFSQQQKKNQKMGKRNQSSFNLSIIIEYPLLKRYVDKWKINTLTAQSWDHNKFCNKNISFFCYR